MVYWFPTGVNVLLDGYTHWIERHRSMVKRFAYVTSRADRVLGSAKQLEREMHDQPEITYHVLEDAERWSNDEKIKICMDQMSTGSQIIGIMGDRRQGKSTLAWQLADLMSKPPYNRKIYTAYCDEAPPIATRISGATECPEGGVFVGDEMHMHGIDARRGNTNAAQALTYTLTVLGHSDRTFIIITQDASLIDFRAKTLFNFLLLKKLPQNATENTKHLIHSGYGIMKPKNKQYTYFQSDTDHLLVKFGMPSWWSNKWSKTFGILKKDIVALEKIIKDSDSGSKDTEIVANLASMGYKISLIEVHHIIHQHNIKLKKMLKNKYKLEPTGATEASLKCDADIKKRVDRLMGGECETPHEVWVAMKEDGWKGSIRDVQHIMDSVLEDRAAIGLAVTSTR